MVAEVEVSIHTHDVGLVLAVFVHEVFEDLHLHKGLVVEALLVANDLERHDCVLLMVLHLCHLAKGSPAVQRDDLVAELDVVALHEPVVPSLVIVAVVVPSVRDTLDLVRVLAEEPNVLVL